MIVPYICFYYALCHGTHSFCIKQGDETEPIHHHQRGPSISISMPPSPVGVHLQNTRRVLFSGDTIFSKGIPDSLDVSSTTISEPPKHHSQPIPTGAAYNKATNGGQFAYHQSIRRLKDKRFDSFKTWSGKLERQITILRGKPAPEVESEGESGQSREMERNLPVDRYFDALEGPELETLKVCVFVTLPLYSFWFLFCAFSTFGLSHLRVRHFTKLGYP